VCAALRFSFAVLTQHHHVIVRQTTGGDPPSWEDRREVFSGFERVGDLGS
jgi:hypothetical protein